MIIIIRAMKSQLEIDRDQDRELNISPTVVDI